MKKILQIVLALLIIGFIYILVMQFVTPMSFEKEVKSREKSVISRIVDIRTAQQSFKTVNQRYVTTFDSLFYFVLNDSLEFSRQFGSRDDSVAVAQGLVREERFKIPVIDTIFGRKMTPAMVEELRYIPYSDLADGQKKEYIMDAGMFETESGVIVPVFECKAPYKLFLADMNEQELINLIDEQKNTYKRYPGIMVGALDRTTNDAGNWE